MNQEIKKQWVAALRSGKYKQTKGTLIETSKKEGLSYCPLGVLTRLCARKQKKSFYAISGGLGDLSYRVQRFAGLRTSDPQLGSYTISERNDDLDQDFNQIARLIKNRL